MTTFRAIISYESPMPIAVREVVIPADHGDIPATLYNPAALPDRLGCLSTSTGAASRSAPGLATIRSPGIWRVHAGVRVLSVEYRRAPEHRFPAAVEDAITAFEYAHRHAAELRRMPTASPSGATAPAAISPPWPPSTRLRRGTAIPAFQLLMYPLMDPSTRRPSRDLFAHSSTFTEKNLQWALANYVPPGTDLTDPRLSPLHGDVTGLPPAYIATAGFDPIRDDGEAYADKLRTAGVPVVLSRQADLPHAYCNFVGLGGRFAEAASEAAGALRLGLAAHAGSAAQRRAGEFVGVGDIP